MEVLGSGDGGPEGGKGIFGERGGNGRGESGGDNESSMKITFGEVVAEVNAGMEMTMTRTCHNKDLTFHVRRLQLSCYYLACYVVV